ncbi:MAG: hypothetical protein GY820_07640 [Gammaproteobacteria bacterium]|nr:hypothetical protein [Gammaproteobacteria bacterium]
MNKYILFLLLVLPCQLIASTFKCAEHDYYLILETGGFEHVNHHLYLNGEILIKELEEGMWFIEETQCTNSGFNVIASHIQYNDSTKRTFTLNIKNNTSYEIK